MATEETVWTGSPSQWLNAGKFALCFLATLTGSLYIVAMPYAIWRWFVVKSMRHELSMQWLKCHSGVLDKTTEELEPYRVKDSRFDEPFLMRMVGLGNVTVVSSDSTTPPTSLLALRESGPRPEKIRALVEERRKQKRVRIAEFE